MKAELWEGEYIGGKILWVKFSEGSKERENHASASGELVSILHPLPWKCAQCSAGLSVADWLLGGTHITFERNLLRYRSLVQNSNGRYDGWVVKKYLGPIRLEVSLDG